MGERERLHRYGTDVAGILGGSTYGVAKGVKLHSVRVVNCYKTRPSAAVVAGLDWVPASTTSSRRRELGLHRPLLQPGAGHAVKTLLRRRRHGGELPAGNSKRRTSASTPPRTSTCCDHRRQRPTPPTPAGLVLQLGGTASTSSRPARDHHLRGALRATPDVTVLTGTSMARPARGGRRRALPAGRSRAPPPPMVGTAHRQQRHHRGFVNDPRIPSRPTARRTSTPRSAPPPERDHHRAPSQDPRRGDLHLAGQRRRRERQLRLRLGIPRSGKRQSPSGRRAPTPGASPRATRPFELRVTVTSGGASASDNHPVSRPHPDRGLDHRRAHLISTAGTYTWRRTPPAEPARSPTPGNIGCSSPPGPPSERRARTPAAPRGESGVRATRDGDLRRPHRARTPTWWTSWTSARSP